MIRKTFQFLEYINRRRVSATKEQYQTVRDDLDWIPLQSLNPQPLNPQSLNPQSLNPQSLNPQPLNPQTLNNACFKLYYRNSRQYRNFWNSIYKRPFNKTFKSKKSILGFKTSSKLERKQSSTKFDGYSVIGLCSWTIRNGYVTRHLMKAPSRTLPSL